MVSESMDNRRKFKIAIINVTAQFGSTGKIAYGMYQKLNNDGYQVRLFYGRKDNIQENVDIVKIGTDNETKIHGGLARVTGLHGYFSTSATKQLIRELEEYKPDLVQLYNLHGYYLNINLLLEYLKNKGVPTVYSMLDEFPYLGRCCYSFDCDLFKNGCEHCECSRSEYPATFLFRWGKKFAEDKRKAYEGFNNICFVAPQWVLERAESSYLLKGKELLCVDEYVDTEDLFYPRTEYHKLPDKIRNTSKKIVLTVAPYSNPRKGGKYFLEAARRFLNDDLFLFVYVGMNVQDVDIPENCIAVGFLNDQDELAEYYSIADVFVCTSLADTMPNVCLDALGAGTPVIGFDNTGIPYVAEEPLGKFVESENVSALCEAIQSASKKDNSVVELCRGYAQKRYSPQTYYRKMLEIYQKKCI